MEVLLGFYLAAAVLGRVDNIWIFRLLPNVCFTLVLPQEQQCPMCLISFDRKGSSIFYAIDYSHRSGRGLVNMTKKMTNVIPIVEDARHPARYLMLVGFVDVIFFDVAQADKFSSSADVERRLQNLETTLALKVQFFSYTPSQFLHPAKRHILAKHLASCLQSRFRVSSPAIHPLSFDFMPDSPTECYYKYIWPEQYT